MKLINYLAAATTVAGISEAALAVYFFNRTMKRNNAKVERTTKMAGTNWDKYRPMIAERKEWMLAQPMEDLYIKSSDGLKLHATYIQRPSNKLVLCFHGYTGKGMSDFIALSDYYLKRNYNMLLVDARAHGDSDGTYIGFGCLDRMDALLWLKDMQKRSGADLQVLLHGISMGGATVLMTSGLELPACVKGIISDCAFTSAKAVFKSVLNTSYHMPAFPLLNLCDELNRKYAGYGLDECNAAREVEKAKVPILLIHGDSDTFVPSWMCDEIYRHCPTRKHKLIIPGAGHAECYYRDTQTYENALNQFTQDLIR